MSEPTKGSQANVVLLFQDFKRGEVSGKPASEARQQIYRAVAAFTCCRVESGCELTWYYSQFHSLKNPDIKKHNVDFRGGIKKPPYVGDFELSNPENTPFWAILS